MPDRKRILVICGLALAAGIVAASLATAAGPCGHCGTAAGMETPYGETGCGPRYWGAVHDEAPWPDPCDACGRWIGGHATRPGLDLMAPWQLPPGRGFQTPAQMGYGPTRGVCDQPGTCHPCASGTLKGFRPGPLWWF